MKPRFSVVLGAFVCACTCRPFSVPNDARLITAPDGGQRFVQNQRDHQSGRTVTRAWTKTGVLEWQMTTQGGGQETLRYAQNGQVKKRLVHRKEGESMLQQTYNAKGILVAETLKTAQDDDITTYTEEGYFQQRQIVKPGGVLSGPLPPRTRPSSVPANAVFNLALNKWEAGSTRGGQKQGAWSLWWPTGEPGGSATYRNGQLHGTATILSKKTGKALLTIEFQNGRRVQTPKAL